MIGLTVNEDRALRFPIMVIRTGRSGGGLRRLFSTRRMIVGGSFLLMMFFYCIALPEPVYQSVRRGYEYTDTTPIDSSNDATMAVSSLESPPSLTTGPQGQQEGHGKIRKARKNRPLAESEKSDVTMTTKSDEARGRTEKASSCSAKGETSEPLCTVDSVDEVDPIMGQGPLMATQDGVDRDMLGRPLAPSEEIANVQDQEREAAQEQDDKQGDEREDGFDQTEIDEGQAALSIAEDRVEEAEEALEVALDELREEEQAQDERIMEQSREDGLENLNLENLDDERLDQPVGSLFQGDDVEDGFVKGDQLGQTSPLETMDDDLD